MTFKTTQKIIKIGDSRGVTLPAKQLHKLGVQAGDIVEVTVRSSEQAGDAAMATAQSILDRYEQDFKNLASR